MVRRVTISACAGIHDSRGEGIEKDALDLGVKGISKVKVSDVYLFEGDITEADIDRIAKELLTDFVTQEYLIDDMPKDEGHVIEVAYNHGVMDPVEGSIYKALRDMGITSVTGAKTMKRYAIQGNNSVEELELIVDKLLVNKIIQHVAEPGEEAFLHAKPVEGVNRIEIDLLGLDDDGLVNLSRDRFLSLNLEEMRTLRDHYKKMDRNPTDIELETFAQTWSEHCVHKTFRGIINYNGEIIDNLLKQTIVKATRDIDHEMCVSVFEDNAGVIRFDDTDNINFKVETHNFPSSLEPYGGAGTGIGGVIRDVLGTGLGAKPIMNTDIFCFAPPDMPLSDVPPGALHPRRIMKGVVSGVRDYGNRMGIPTSNGSVMFDKRYVGNPIVYCGTLGIMPKECSFKKVSDGDVIVLIGGRTGRDGIHGATLSSTEVTEESETTSSHAVQIGNAIQEKKVTDTLILARDRGLYSALTDCGAGGLSSAVGEMGEHTGAVVDLEKVPLKYAGLQYWEIWVSEAQERMVLAVPPDKVDELLTVFDAEDVEAIVIGTFTGNGTLTLRYHGVTVGEFDCAFLHGGVPRLERTATWERKQYPEPDFPCPSNLGEPLKKILGAWNVCSKEWVVRQYDHEVQGGSVVKPLTGASNDGPSDACVLRPKLGSNRGIAVSNGINPKYGVIDPYYMAMSVIDEALRQITAVGGDIRKTALLDNFAWGNTTIPDRLGDLVRASCGCYDAAVGFGTPFISGKDSLRNEFIYGDQVIRIPSTLLISALSVMEDVTKAVTMDFKAPKHAILVVGLTKDEMGGSHYWDIKGFTGNSVPDVDVDSARKTMIALHETMDKGLVLACHDCSEGGIGVAIAEMAFAGEVGAAVDLTQIPAEPCMRDDHILFSESNSRFIIEVVNEQVVDIMEILNGIPCAKIGTTTNTKQLQVKNANGILIEEDIFELKEAWQKPLRTV
ncbi:MAG: phosphoribosylformylglycinamidine synthase subunit PurL [Candidatus Latescibacteria bacterium]|nr:phosphoribosylformylglycinamidine synthase subunit PurL [Candidatus Latescibacterota bacterium]